MTDHDKQRIKPLDEKGDYRLWKIRIEAACDAKDLMESLINETSPEDDGDKKKEFEASQKKASNIIVHALEDNPLRVVRSVIGNPFLMLQKLDDRYDSKSSASRISKMTELISMRYVNLKKDIGTHIDQMAAVLEQLESMETKLPDELAIALLVSSIDVPELSPVTAAIKTLSDDKAKWEDVTARLIEEQQSIRMKTPKHERLNAGLEDQCHICHKRNHNTANCFLNPKNPKNRLNLPKSRDYAEKKDGNPAPVKDQKDQKKPVAVKQKTRVAVARSSSMDDSSPQFMMLDSGTTSHITPTVESLKDARSCNVDIYLGDNSTVAATHKGKLSVNWSVDRDETAVQLSDVLSSPQVAMDLLSIPALAEKGICALFLPSKALLIDLYDNSRVIGCAPRQEDGLYYIMQGGDCAPAPDLSSNDKKSARLMMAVAASLGETQVSSLFYDSDEDSLPDLQSEDEYSSESEDRSSPDSDAESETSSESDTSTENGASMVFANVDDTVRLGSGHEVNDPTSLYFDEDDITDMLDDDLSHCDEASDRETAVEVWHRRLGHLGSEKTISQMIADGILSTTKRDTAACEECEKGKFRRTFQGSLTSATEPGHLHVDLVGPVNPPSFAGHRYFLTIVDEATRFVATYPMQKKSESSDKIMHFVHHFERQSQYPVLSLHSDGAKEFRPAEKTLKATGVTTTDSTAYTPESNGLVERSQGVLLGMIRACLSQASVSKLYWPYALAHATDSKNLVTHSTTKKIPFIHLFEKIPPYAKHLRPFGCRTLFAPVRSKLPKFDARLKEGICLGHIQGGIYNILSSTGIVRTKHVKMKEKEFPSIPTDEVSVPFQVEDTQQPFHGSHPPFEDDDDDPGESSQVQQADLNIEALSYIPAQPSTFGQEDSQPTATDPADQEEEQEAEHPTPSSRQTATPHNLRSRATVTIPSITTPDEPTLSQAFQSDEASLWKESIEEEFETLHKAETWREATAEDKPNNIIPSGVILKVKRNEDGQASRFKSRLVARGNLQKNSSTSYAELYAPVAPFELVRILLLLSTAFNWSRYQLDIKGAFLNATLPQHEQVWMRLPRIPGVNAANGKIVRLLKSLYGLRNAPRLWYSLLAHRLQAIGFRRLVVSECLFLLTEGESIVILLAYVDDLALFGTKALIRTVKDKLMRMFDVKDLGKCSFFLGVKIQDVRGGISLSQGSLTHRLLEETSMLSSKPARTPLPMGHTLYDERKTPTESEAAFMNNVPYQSVLGSLLFLSTRTRPDLSAAVSMLGKFASSPTPAQWKMMKHVLRYLAGTSDYGILYKARRGMKLVGCSDADWARDSCRRSRSGILITLNGSPVIWTSKMQTAVALSTAEAEFSALAHCVREVYWVRSFFVEIGLTCAVPSTIYQDNLGAISWTRNVEGLRRVKHVGIKYNYVKEAVQEGSIVILYVTSESNQADVLTKANVGSTFAQQRDWLQVQEVEPSRGGVSRM